MRIVSREDERMDAIRLRTPLEVGKRALGIGIMAARAEAEWFWGLHSHRRTPDERSAQLAAIVEEQARLASWLAAEALWDVLTPFEASLLQLDAGAFAIRLAKMQGVLMTMISVGPILLWAAGRDARHRDVPWASPVDWSYSINSVPIGLSASALAGGVALRSLSEVLALRERCVDRISQEASRRSKPAGASDEAASPDGMTLEEYAVQCGEDSIQTIDWLTGTGDWDVFYR
jgi:hypothetical protein